MKRDVQGEQPRVKNQCLSLTRGSDEAQEQVSHRGKDISVPYFTEAVLHKHLHSWQLLNLCCSHGKKLKEGYQWV